MGIPDLLYYAMPAFLAAIIIEYWLSVRLHIDLYDREDTQANFGIAFGGVLMGGLASSYGLSIYYFCYAQASGLRKELFGFESLGWAWYIWIAAVLADDFTFYWFHRLSHKVRVLWACHIVHHSSTHFNYSTAIRNGWFSIFYKPIFWTWMALIGFHPLMILSCLSVNAVYQFFCHTTIGYSWHSLGQILCTPGVHAIHHGKSQEHIDRNFAGIFIFYDRIFGTFTPFRGHQQIAFGVTHPPKTMGVFDITFHEFRHIFQALNREPNWRYKIALLFGPPNWKRPGKGTQPD